jgi:hypothetical protein
MWVDSDGNLKRENDGRKICRWSFHKGGMDLKTRWQGKAHQIIHDGDECLLHCHSYWCGSYRSVEQAPYFAPNVHANNDGNLRVNQFKQRELQFAMSNPSIGFVVQQAFLWINDGFVSPLNKDDPSITDWMTKYDWGQVNDDQNPSMFWGINDPDNLAKLKPHSNFPDAIQKSVEDKVWKTWFKWGDDTGFKQEVKFKVKYVYPTS